MKSFSVLEKIATSNKKLLGAPGLTTRSKDATLLGAPGIATMNKKLLEKSFGRAWELEFVEAWPLVHSLFHLYIHVETHPLSLLFFIFGWWDEGHLEVASLSMRQYKSFFVVTQHQNSLDGNSVPLRVCRQTKMQSHPISISGSEEHAFEGWPIYALQ